jgi:DNA-binding MarR family transcriptional regulator
MSSAPSTAQERLAGRFDHFVGEDALASWTPEQKLAWMGFLETHQRLQRDMAAELEAATGLSTSAVGVLGRLAAAPEGRARLTALAAGAGLSLSRISRVVDGLEQRGLVERRPCPADARAINAHLLPPGRALARTAQERGAAFLRARFFGRLPDDEVAALARAFARLGAP